MGSHVRLEADDGHQFGAYHAVAGGRSVGAVVVVQEIFGVNGHIRDVCDRFAAAGFDAVAPALFDRATPDVELDYVEADIQTGRELAASIGWDKPILDIAAAARMVSPQGRAAAVGYCWGASWVWDAACRADLSAAVCYYGRHIVEHLDSAPRCPVLMHFGALDASIPISAVAAIEAAFPSIPIHVYEGAGHGFNCDRRGDYRPECAEQATRRTLAFLRSAH